MTTVKALTNKTLTAALLAAAAVAGQPSATAMVTDSQADVAAIAAAMGDSTAYRQPLNGIEAAKMAAEKLARSKHRANGKNAGGYTQIPDLEEQPAELRPVRPAIEKVREGDEESDDYDVTRQLDPRYTDGSASRDMAVAPRHAVSTIAIVMPFQLDEAKVSRQANLVTDFYRGFLCAVDTMSRNGMLPQLQLLVYDTRNSNDRVANFLRLEKRLAEADVIIAPNNAEQLDMIAKYGAEHGVPVLNTFVARDDSYITNPSVWQVNIPSAMMLDKAADYFVNTVTAEQLTPVILQASADDSDHQDFVDAVTARLAARGIQPVVIPYGRMVTADDLAERLGQPSDTRYMILPSSGQHNDFVRNASALIKYKDGLLGAGGDMLLFGYPEWIAFRGDAMDMMYTLDTTIYSRFGYDANSYETQGVEDAFRHWYGNPTAEGMPSQGILGFDTGCFILNNLASGHRMGGRLMNGWRGAQSAFDFGRVDGVAGHVNQAMYIVKYLPGGFTATNVI